MIGQHDVYIASIDQGTSSSRVNVFSAKNGEVAATHQVQLRCGFPADGWVEMDADKMYDTTLECLNKCAEQLEAKKIDLKLVRGIGITNQRETSICWDRRTGKTLYPAIVWSDSRTAGLVQELIQRTSTKNKNAFQEISGLPIHSYFSAVKLCWMLRQVPAVSEAAKRGDLLFGTVDTWLIWRLTKGEAHVTDVTNASRTLLFNLKTLSWDKELCSFFGIDTKVLPRVVSSAEVVGKVTDLQCKLVGQPICGILGDQQASLVGQTWTCKSSASWAGDQVPDVKITYGTGAFMLWNIGGTPLYSDHGMLTTIAYKMGANAEVNYALEGAVANAGAALTWARHDAQLFKDFGESESLASKVMQTEKSGDSVDPCYFVPAFNGLFCPHWQESARALFSGISSDVKRGDLIYAVLRSAAFQTEDIIHAATQATGHGEGRTDLSRPNTITVDGGMTASRVVMQSLADILNLQVKVPNHPDVISCLGAAIAAAIGLGVDPAGLLLLRSYPASVAVDSYSFSPRITAAARKAVLAGWKASVQRSLAWTTDVAKLKDEASTVSPAKEGTDYNKAGGKCLLFFVAGLIAGGLIGSRLLKQ